jgi:7-keto-8-aminopelargonate synthetase-like enzyme
MPSNRATPGPRQKLIDFSGCDYLGLASHPAVVDAMCHAAGKYRISASSSRWALGWTDLHEQLETELARFMGTEAACIFGAAYLGGPIYYSSLASERRTVFCDEMVHSNQFLGMRAEGLDIRKFRHLDIEDLSDQLRNYDGPPPIIATDGVYGISGEVAPLVEMTKAAAEIGAEFFVDDAHGVGALGATGRGSAEAAGLKPGQATVLGSMSKAMGCGGGFLAGRKQLVERFRRNAHASGSALPPIPITQACLKSLQIIREEPRHRKRLDEVNAALRGILAENRIEVAAADSPIIALLLEDEHEAARLADHLLTYGLRIPYFKYASEPRTNMLRAAARAIYTEEHLNSFAEAIKTRPRT